MRTRLSTSACIAALLSIPMAGVASAQSIDVRGYGLAGTVTFAAAESFEAVLGNPSGPIFGGGAEVGLPFGGLYVGAGGWRFRQDGERVFVSGEQIFPLGIPVTVQVTAVEITGGWRFRNLSRRFVPYAGAGWSAFGYEETSRFAEPGENVDERFSGYHLLAGAELRITAWLGIGGEVAWTRIPDALGDGGVSEAFGESDLGGTSLRLKISIGR
ncbi:MAG: outer membrane beta-barrel protein [Acidobacteria bacterium]|nr:outer membrane beta-barrel protein [Acidobacteriota bacterium]